MKNKNKIKGELKSLEERLEKKINQQFYTIVVMILLLLGALKFTLDNFSGDVNEAIRIKPAKAVKPPAIRKA